MSREPGRRTGTNSLLSSLLSGGLTVNIVDLEDLKKYLETRVEMIQRNGPRNLNSWERGAVYAFGESLKAVQSTISSMKGVAAVSQPKSKKRKDG